MQQRILMSFVQETAEDWFTITDYKSKVKKFLDFRFPPDDWIERLGIIQNYSSVVAQTLELNEIASSFQVFSFGRLHSVYQVHTPPHWLKFEKMCSV